MRYPTDCSIMIAGTIIFDTVELDQLTIKPVFTDSNNTFNKYVKYYCNY